MAYNITLKTFKAVEDIQLGSKRYVFVTADLIIDTDEIQAVTPFWNDINTLWDFDKTVAVLKSGETVNIDSTYTEMQNLLAPGSPGGVS
jgi:hypothetical protein|tara:strand:+ start:497 stop:763 length:267 start_codon:yes stop_codon:yes gene_type:complete